MKLLGACIISVMVLLNGCSNADSKYNGWEQVRIGKISSSDQCKYVAQQVCYPLNAHEGCANFHKKKAAQNNANTIVIDQANVTGDSGILADYYLCK